MYKSPFQLNYPRQMIAFALQADVAARAQVAFEKGMIERLARFPAGKSRAGVAEALIAVFGEDAQLRRVRGAVVVAGNQHVRPGGETVTDETQLAVLVNGAEAQMHIGDDQLAARACPGMRDGSGWFNTSRSGVLLRIRLPCSESLPRRRLVCASA